MDREELSSEFETKNRTIGVTNRKDSDELPSVSEAVFWRECISRRPNDSHLYRIALFLLDIEGNIALAVFGQVFIFMCISLIKTTDARWAGCSIARCRTSLTWEVPIPLK